MISTLVWQANPNIWDKLSWMFSSTTCAVLTDLQLWIDPIVFLNPPKTSMHVLKYEILRFMIEIITELKKLFYLIKGNEKMP